MSLVVLGTNHKSAMLAIRERWAYGINEVPAALKKISKKLAINEVVLLSTCNRTEIYCDIENADDLINWFNKEIKPVTLIDLNEHGYLYQNQQAVMHLMRVASGLDSMVIGEPQILGQFKQAYKLAKDARTIGKKFDKLFDQVFIAAKTVRAHTDIGLHSLSVACASVNLLLTELDHHNLSDLEVLLIGSGDTIKIIAKTLINKNIKNIHIVSRTKEHACALADYLHKYDRKNNNIKVHDYELLKNIESCNFDVVISATQSSDYVLNYNSAQKLVKQNKNKKLLLMDLAVPRDIDPSCCSLEQVCLYTIDDLQLILQSNTEKRQESVLEAEKIIKQHANDFFTWEKSLLVLSSICQYRQQAEAMCSDVIEKAKRKLEAGQDPEDVLINALELLRNKLLHHPTTTLKSLAQQQKISEVELLKDFLNI